jgi:tetratricopeptide (TPR) repeat protein
MAYSAYKDFIYAEKEKKQLRELMKDSGLAVPIKPFSPAIQGAKCAEEMLSGFISLNQNKFSNAIQHFENATKIERNMTYNEPRDWLVSPKQYLGVAYLSGKNYSAAQKIFESDLKVNADNVWSLFGLEQSLLKQKKGSEAIKVKKKLEKNLRTGDTNPEIML